ncbi:Keratan-sulfate endo-1,4-beta-galactosidase [Pontiella desulfatans]|uniref:Keratan-sulfate endo-1,4-beta-galactosidase n=1 Tax=Pontiella desulfatans TaxID=2750659 RepID=A0A6C2U4Y7_PONDE|nr:right-handed parallel beta-helix repeat-containing protein [Pontiella desulfatans]VGO15128.1 Keratan-sulfate endo-1,4-beta-galactosidase [Pontiella desulfatans]
MMKARRSGISAAFILAVACLPVFGAVYYVSPTGDDNNFGTITEPWRTIQNAADWMVAGDTCMIRGGTYRETVIPASSGTAGNPITYAAYNGETVIIHGCEPVLGPWTLGVAGDQPLDIDENFDGALPTAGWNYAAGTGVVVANNGPESAFTAHPGGGSLALDLTATQMPKVYKTINVNGTASTQPLHMEFDMNSTVGGPEQTFQLYGADGQGILFTVKSGTVKYDDGSGRVTIGSVSLNQWYHYHFVVSPETNGVNDTMDVTITDTNGTAVVTATNLPFRNDISSYDELRWLHNVAAPQNGGNFYVDNVRVWTPDVVVPQILADYGFDSGTGAADAADPNLTAGDVTKSTGSFVTTDNTNKLSSDGLPQWKKYGAAATLDFTLTPDADFRASCRALSFEIQMDAGAADGSKNRKMELTSSATGTNILYAVYNTHYAADLGVTGEQALGSGFETKTVDLSGWSELKSATNPVTFTFTFSGPGADDLNMRLDAIKLEGPVDQVNVYAAEVEMALGHENQIFVNGSHMAWEARWPNVGTDSLDGLLEFQMATMESGTTSNSIVDSSIPDYDWTGGQAWVSSYKRWSAWSGEITGFGSGEISLVNNADSKGNMICKEDGKFYLFGVRDALDSANEWYYDGTYLHLWAPGGGVPTGVEVKKRLYGFDLSGRDFIRLEGLDFFATGINTSGESDALEFDRLTLKHIYHSNNAEKGANSQSSTGLLLYGTNHRLENSEIAYSSGTGVYLGGSGHWIVNNYIHDHDYIGSYASPLVLKGSDFVISHNTISRAGRQCINLGEMYGSLIQYNDVSYAGYLTWDLGLVYGNSIAGGDAEVRYNWFHHNLATGHGNGIYYDHNCKNILTHHNAVWGVSKKAIAHNQYANYLLYFNNTGSTSGDTAIGSAWNAGQQRDLHGCRYINNVFNAGTDFDGNGYTFENNFINYSQIISNRYLTPATAPVDAAVPLEGITDSWEGAGPDAGAYEIGGTDWTPGHDFASPPLMIDTTRSLVKHRNMLINGSFEAGTLTPWQSMGGAASLLNENNKSQWVADGNTLGGAYSVELGEGACGVSQVITNLEPYTEYEFMGKFRVEPGESAYLGVRNHGNAETNGTVITDTVTGAVPIRADATPYEWEQTTLTFTTGPTNTSAEVYAWKNSTGSGGVYFEDAGVQFVQTLETIIVDEDFAGGLGDWAVTDDVATNSSAQSPFSNGGADTVGALFMDDTNTLSRIERNFSVADSAPLYIQFDYRYTGAVANPGFQLKQGSTVGINVHLTSGIGKVQYKDGATWMTLGTAPHPDTWYRFTLSILPAETADDRFDMRIQGLDYGSIDITHTNLGFQNDLTDFGTLRFHYNTGDANVGGTYHIDNVLVTRSPVNLNFDVLPEEVPFETFISDHGLSGDPIADFDSDGLLDYGEYVFGGNPTNGWVDAQNPEFDAADGDYIFSLIGDSNVVAYVVSSTNLLDGAWETNETVSVTANDGMMKSYTNHNGTSEPQRFIKLELEMP